MIFWLLWGTTLTLLGFSCITIMRMERKARLAEKADHAKCVAHIADVTSHRVVAQAFSTAATKWDSVEEQTELKRLANERYVPGGPSMPAIWMREQSARLGRGEQL